jgi:Flp pilus assembly pilin Flp
MNQVKRFLLDETALETVEWAIVGGIITAVGAALYVTIGGDISRGLGSLSTVTNGIP